MLEPVDLNIIIGITNSVYRTVTDLDSMANYLNYNSIPLAVRNTQ